MIPWLAAVVIGAAVAIAIMFWLSTIAGNDAFPLFMGKQSRIEKDALKKANKR